MNDRSRQEQQVNQQNDMSCPETDRERYVEWIAKEKERQEIEQNERNMRDPIYWQEKYERERQRYKDLKVMFIGTAIMTTLWLISEAGGLVNIIANFGT